MPDAGPHDLLIPPVEEAEAAARGSQRLRVGALVVLTLFVLAGLFNVFGVRSTTTRGSDGPLSLAVEHPGVARAGLAAPLTITVQRAGGFEGPLEVRISSDYMGSFDENGLDPEPDSAASDGEWLVWTWDEVDGTTHEIDFDGRLEPGVHWRFQGAVQVRTANEMVDVDLDTWVAP
jgi:hypothetical protein